MLKVPVIIIVVFASSLLAGCIADQEAPTGPATDGDVRPADTNNTTSPSPEPTGTVAPDPPHVGLTASNLTAEAPAEIVFNLSSEERDAAFLDWTLDADGNGTVDASGYGFPADVTFRYALPGNYTATLTATDVHGAIGNATIEIVIVEKPPLILPDPIYFNGTITGLSDQLGGYLIGGEDTHVFNLTQFVNNITITFTVGDTAIDLDFTLLRPDGEVAEEVAATNDPTGQVRSKADPPIFEEEREDLDMYGEWTLIVHPFISYEGTYSAHVVFG